MIPYFKLTPFLVLFLFSGFLTSQETIFNQQFEALISKHNSSEGFSYKAIDSTRRQELRSSIAGIENYQASTVATQINLYNFLVIDKVLESMPLASVGEVSGFFKDEVSIGSETISLDQLEKAIIQYADNPFVHLLLNCAAKGCPPMQFISDDIPLENYISTALKSSNVLSYEQDDIELSQIFFWYKEDFGTDEALITRISEILSNSDIIQKKIKYKEYDWLLNDSGSRDGDGYYPTKLYSKGGGELKIFNNYYTQKESDERYNFFSSFFQFLIGTNKNINYGLDVKIRSVNQGNVGTFSALGFSNSTYGNSEGGEFFSRVGISGIGPRIKYQPFKKKNNINFLHTIYFVPMSSAEGNDEYGYSDYNNLQFFNQMFIEKELGARRRLFLDVGLHIENIKLGVHRNENHFMPIQLPVTAIYSYFPTTKSTLYGLGSFGQRIDVRFAPNQNTNGKYSVYGQLGLGAKYFLTDFLEAELLYTNFLDTTPGRSAHTFNLTY